MSKVKRLVSLFCCLCVVVILTGCKDKSYAGLYTSDNSNQIYEICRNYDPTFLQSDADDMAKVMENIDYKKIKKVVEKKADSEGKIILTDTNGVGLLIIVTHNKVVALQDEGGNSLYTRSAKKSELQN